MAHEIQFNSTKIQEAINVFLELLDTKLFVNVTVKQLMEGRRTIWINSAYFYPESTSYFLGYTDPLIETASLIKPGVLKDNKFGILQPVR